MGNQKRLAKKSLGRSITIQATCPEKLKKRVRISHLRNKTKTRGKPSREGTLNHSTPRSLKDRRVDKALCPAAPGDERTADNKPGEIQIRGAEDAGETQTDRRRAIAESSIWNYQ